MTTSTNPIVMNAIIANDLASDIKARFKKRMEEAARKRPNTKFKVGDMVRMSRPAARAILWRGPLKAERVLKAYVIDGLGYYDVGGEYDGMELTDRELERA